MSNIYSRTRKNFSTIPTPYCPGYCKRKSSFQYRVPNNRTNRLSEETSWEAPDPDFGSGKTGVIASIWDKRGFGKSDGAQEMLDDASAKTIMRWALNLSLPLQEWSG